MQTHACSPCSAEENGWGPERKRSKERGQLRGRQPASQWGCSDIPFLPFLCLPLSFSKAPPNQQLECSHQFFYEWRKFSDDFVSVCSDYFKVSMTGVWSLLRLFTLKGRVGFPLVVQGGSVICPSVQKTWVQSLIREDPTCHGAGEPVHSYWALGPGSHKYGAHMQQPLKPWLLEPMLLNKRSHFDEQPSHHN